MTPMEERKLQSDAEIAAQASHWTVRHAKWAGPLLGLLLAGGGYFVRVAFADQVGRELSPMAARVAQVEATQLDHGQQLQRITEALRLLRESSTREQDAARVDRKALQEVRERLATNSAYLETLLGERRAAQVRESMKGR